MITERQQEQASLYVLSALTSIEQVMFEEELRGNTELQEFVNSLRRTTDLLAMASPAVAPSPELRSKVFQRVDSFEAARPSGQKSPAELVSGLRFLNANDATGWKQLPVAGAWIKLLSLERERGYAVVLGKLEPGVRYPAHTNAGPEDIYLLTGDLHVGERVLRAGDFHHADSGSQHVENFSEEGCTLLAVLTTDDPLVEFAMT